MCEDSRYRGYVLKIFALVMMLAMGISSMSGQPADPSFACDGSFFLVTTTSGGSKLQRLVRDTASGIVKAEQIQLSTPAVRLTCLGFNIQDQHLYALDFDTYELLRINATGHVARLGVPENLNTTDYEFYAGDVNPNGTALTVVGRERTSGADKILYNISLFTSRPYAGSVAIVSNVPVAIADFATDPISGVRYGFDSRNHRLINFGSGEVNTYQFKSITPAAHALFFDREGRLFGFGDPSGGSSSSRLFAIDKKTGNEERLAWQGATGQDSDGCSCPYTIQFYRSVTPEVVLPCTEITVEYKIINRTGNGRLGGTFMDLFPPEFTITEIEENTASLSTLEAGPGGNLLQLTNFDMRLGRNVLRLTASVGENAEGAYEMQASVDNLPRGLGEVLWSDNPVTPAPGDPNIVEVGRPETLGLDIMAGFNCERDSATLRVPIMAASYQWNDGATTPTLTVPASGQYWVEAATDCFTYRDTIRIADIPDPLQLELGGDRALRLGDRLSLSFSTNGTGPLQYRWSTSTGRGLSCGDCPNPEFEALEDAVIFLKITDAEGCTAEDDLFIKVDPVRHIYLPNVFSPNGDGLNDRFFPQGTNGEIDRFQVFNRWGALVFEARGGAVNDSTRGWDGQVNGRPAEKGVYLFALTLIFPDGDEAVFTGDLVLLR